MQDLLLALSIFAYLALGYLLMVGLVWLVTRSEPELWYFRDLAMKPLVLVLASLGVNFAAQASRPEVIEALDRERTEDSEPARGEANRFRSGRAAKEYLIAQIVGEAQREGVPLTEVERKMLYFSETGWTLPGIMEVSADFDRDYDQDAYEAKIAGLVHALEDHVSAEDQEAWDDAVLKLSEGDHYLLVLVGASQGPHSPAARKLDRWLPSLDPKVKRPPHDLLRLIVVALVITIAVLAGAILTSHR